MKNKEKEVLKKTVIRSSLLLISIFSLIFGILITIEGITNNKKEKEELISYESNGNIDYQISLKENDFYNIENTNYKNIIGKYIDNINLRFNYEFSASNLLNSEVKYSLKLYLVSEYTANNKKEEIWKQEYELIPETEELNINSGIVTISKDITFNYDEYNEIAKKVRSESGVLTDSYIKVEFIVNNKLELIEKDMNFNDNHTLVAKISLLDNIATFEKINEYNNKETLYNIISENANYPLLITGICLLLVSLLLLVQSLKMFINTSAESKYIIEQNKILKRYGDVIAETSTKPNLENTNIIEITNFIDMINIEDELRIPILFYENVKGKESWFIIINNDKAYRYILKIKLKRKSNVS